MKKHVPQTFCFFTKIRPIFGVRHMYLVNLLATKVKGTFVTLGIVNVTPTTGLIFCQKMKFRV